MMKILLQVTTVSSPEWVIYLNSVFGALCCFFLIQMHQDFKKTIADVVKLKIRMTRVETKLKIENEEGEE